MTLWQFAACIDGWNRAHQPEDKLEPPSDEEFDAMKENSVMPDA